MSTRKVAAPKVKRTKNNQVLVLIDHDGTLCDTNPSAYESIKYAFDRACENQRVVINGEVNWDKIMDDLRGTTEKNLVRYLCYSFNIPFEKSETFEQRFYYFREKWYENSRKLGEFIWDTYYPDTHQLLTEYSRFPRYILWLLTGNPDNVIEQRLSNSLRTIFSNKKDKKLQGVFGNESYTRKGMIELACTKAEVNIEGFKVHRDEMGYTTNVVYIADSRHDFFSGIEAKVKMVWVPSRSLQDTIEMRSQDYVKFAISTLGEKRLLIVNDLYTEKVKEFIR